MQEATPPPIIAAIRTLLMLLAKVYMDRPLRGHPRRRETLLCSALRRRHSRTFPPLARYRVVFPVLINTPQPQPPPSWLVLGNDYRCIMHMALQPRTLRRLPRAVAPFSSRKEAAVVGGRWLP